MNNNEESSQLVLLTQTNTVATITLNRPDKFNALSMGMLSTLKETLESVSNNKEVRVVILEARGKGFCAGHDLKEMRADRSEEYAQELFQLCSEVMLKITDLPQPVIAKVHATAVAAGCQLIASCDLAYASENAKFGVNGINLGLFCSTPAVPVSRNISKKRAMDLLLTGRLIEASTAAKWGLINEAVSDQQLDSIVQNVALTISKKLPDAVRLGKELYNKQIELDLKNAYHLATDTIVCNLMMEEAGDGISNFLDRK